MNTRIGRGLVCLSTALSLAISTTYPSDAHAAPSGEERSKRDTARRYVDAGLAAQQSGDYAAAVDFYLRAYDLVPHPLLIYNMAEAHRLAGHTADALAHYRRYLAADPKGPRSQDATSQLAPLEKAEADRLADEARKAEVQREAEAAEASARQAEEQRQADETRRAKAAQVAEQRRREQAESDLSLADTRGRSKQRGDRLKLSGYAAGAMGLAGLGLGAYFGLRAGKLSDEVSLQYDAGKQANGESAERIQLVALSAGGALTVAGAVLLIVGLRASSGSSIAVSPTRDDGVAVTVGGGW